MITVLHCLPDYRSTSRVGRHPTSGNQAGWDAIPATFTPRARRHAASPAHPLRPRLRDRRRHRQGDGIVAIQLRDRSGAELPLAEPGRTELRLPSGRLRHYCSPTPSAPRRHVSDRRARRPEQARIARDYEVAQSGAPIHVTALRNNFPLVDARACCSPAASGHPAGRDGQRVVAERATPGVDGPGGRPRMVAFVAEPGVLGERLTVIRTTPDIPTSSASSAASRWARRSTAAVRCR